MATSYAVDVKPKNISVSKDISTTYTETRTINKAQPIPWGLNWLITYPVSLTFIAPRL